MTLTRNHAHKTFFCFFWNCSRNSKNILHRITITKPITFSIINKRSSTAPCKCNQTVIKSPNIYSVINIFIWCDCFERTKFSVPVIYKFFKFFISTFKVSKFIYNFLTNSQSIINTKHEHNFFCFARLKFQITLNCTTSIITKSFRICTSSIHNSFWMFIRTISSDKRFTTCIKTCHRSTHKSNPFTHVSATDIIFRMLDIKIILRNKSQKIIANFFTFCNKQ